jgi:hypothetical protein
VDRLLDGGGTVDTELALAMLYLDRACSVETPRSARVAPCPFVTPRTTHRLVLTALLVAHEAIHGVAVSKLIADKQSLWDTLGIPTHSLQQMVDWLTAALGHQGSIVTPLQLQEWMRVWEERFGPAMARASVTAQSDAAVAVSVATTTSTLTVSTRTATVATTTLASMEHLQTLEHRVHAA